MTNQEWIQMLELIPEEQQPQMVIVLKNNAEIVIETFFRFEENYAVLRGRQGGTIEEARAFFVPYDQMVYYRLERSVKLSELYLLFGETPPAGIDKGIMDDQKKASVVAQVDSPSAAISTVGNKNQLLDRLRAVRAITANSPKSNGSPSD